MTTASGPLALVLGGGGALGARQVGAMAAIVEARLRPHLLVGTSVGALNAAAAALDPANAVDRLRWIWGRMRAIDLFSVHRRRAERAPAICDATGLARIIAEGIGDVTFEDLQVPLVVVATDRRTRERVLIDSGRLAPALMASAAIPFVFPAIDVGGRTLVDGGFSDVLPVQVAVARGAARVLAAPARTTVPPAQAHLHDHAPGRVLRLAAPRRERLGPAATFSFALTEALMTAGEREAREALRRTA
ncbi:MAG: patatin-like phospholipase family protein [Kineosporiaceae bacterium]